MTPVAMETTEFRALLKREGQQLETLIKGQGITVE